MEGISHRSCQLLAGSFALGLQVFIGLFAGSSLFCKYYLERPQRKFAIFLLDVSKQGISSILIHFWNILQSIEFSKLSRKSIESNQNQSKASSDQCANYFIYFALDTFLGVYIVYLTLHGVHRIALRYNLVSIKHQGYYGSPRRMSWYFQQLLVFLGAIIWSKLLLGLLMYAVSSYATAIGNILFEPFHMFHPNIELLFVMVICPFFLSIVQVSSVTYQPEQPY